jgi:hypothetical protein
LTKVGSESLINWSKFSQSGIEIINSINEFNRVLNKYREQQNANFLAVMKKLKGLDLPDLIKSVKSKKLPKEVLKGSLKLFRVG